jgi:hypothetical protein
VGPLCFKGFITDWVVVNQQYDGVGIKIYLGQWSMDIVASLAWELGLDQHFMETIM